MKTKTIGDVTIDSIWEFGGPYRDASEIYPDITPEIIARHRPWMIESCMEEATDLLVFAFQSFLIRTPDHTILVDCCVGEDKERPLRPAWHRKKWPWMANLLAAGVTPEDIDFVMCTHLHVDHVGWNTQLKDGRWVPTFEAQSKCGFPVNTAMIFSWAFLLAFLSQRCQRWNWVGTE